MGIFSGGVCFGGNFPRNLRKFPPGEIFGGGFPPGGISEGISTWEFFSIFRGKFGIPLGGILDFTSQKTHAPLGGVSEETRQINFKLC